MYIERHKRNGCKILVYSLPREALPFLNYLYQDAKTKKKCVCVRVCVREREKEGGREGEMDLHRIRVASPISHITVQTTDMGRLFKTRTSTHILDSDKLHPIKQRPRVTNPRKQLFRLKNINTRRHRNGTATYWDARSESCADKVTYLGNQ